MTRSAARLYDALRTAERGHRRHAKGGRRASIAAIFRVHPTSGEEQVLFIRRADNPRDPWSGNVALPGGRQDAVDGGDDEATATRETLEEVGLDLTGWERLGRLTDDRIVKRAGGSMAVSMFGFVARNGGNSLPSGDELTLQASEVAEAWWVNTCWIDADRLEWRKVGLGTMVKGLSSWPVAARVLHVLGLDSFNFAAIALPLPVTMAPLPPLHPNHETYQLWGLTLAFFSDVLRNSGGRPLVGAGAPEAFAHAFTSSSQSALARSASWMFHRVRIHGAKPMAAVAVAAFSAAVGFGVAAIRYVSSARYIT
uniref:Nudix hydrolase domain-containing protein n=1 Tax=Haptolina brevifila TaxID=156173 RepID=A0A7S2H138_9EUKA|mmetsp:Transcript_49989/g.99558  ORF Transcript_49989/g.99558 Transcript_49989/m.99558 type:complete len:311 (+) Transcript_49989:29-961(+)